MNELNSIFSMEKNAEETYENMLREQCGNFNKALEIYKKRLLNKLNELFPLELREMLSKYTYYTNYYPEGVENEKGNELFHTNGDENGISFQRLCGRFSYGDFRLHWGRTKEQNFVTFVSGHLSPVNDYKKVNVNDLNRKIEALKVSVELLEDITANIELIYQHIKEEVEEHRITCNKRIAELHTLGTELTQFIEDKPDRPHKTITIIITI